MALYNGKDVSTGTGGTQGFPPLPRKYLLLIGHGTRGKINVLNFIYTDGPQKAPTESFYPMVTQMTLDKQRGHKCIQKRGHNIKPKVMYPGKGLAGMGVWNGHAWEDRERVGGKSNHNTLHTFMKLSSNEINQ